MAWRIIDHRSLFLYSKEIWNLHLFMLQTQILDTRLYLRFLDSSVSKELACTAGDPHLNPGSGKSAGEERGYPPQYPWASLVAQQVKKPPAMWETRVYSLGWEDSMEKQKASREFHGLYTPWTHNTTEWFSLSHLYFSRINNTLCLLPESGNTLCDPMDCSPSGFSVHGILQARILEWVSIFFSINKSTLQLI